MPALPRPGSRRGAGPRGTEDAGGCAGSPSSKRRKRREGTGTRCEAKRLHTTMNTSRRRLQSADPFLINERSLKRLRDALQELLPSDGGVQCSVETRDRERLVGTAEEVLAHPNLERDPIVFLKLVAGKYPREITFAANSEAEEYSSTLKVEVETKDDGDAGRWLERMERELETLRMKGLWYTIKQKTRHSILGSPVFFGLWFVLGTALFLVIQARSTIGPEQMWLSRQDAQELLSKPDVTMEDIARLQLRNRLDGTGGIQIRTPSRRTVAWTLPLVVIYLLTLYIMRNLLPLGVFEWGDRVQRHADTVKRRDWVVNLIWSSFVIEVIGALWAASALK